STSVPGGPPHARAGADAPGTKRTASGAPAMIRAAAKNHADVAVVVEPQDYALVLAELEQHKGTTLALREKLAAKAFARSAAYDAAISNWFAQKLSYNNINDTDAAYECVAEFDPRRMAACAIIKHANPCGVAEGRSLLEAYKRALLCDPT